LCRNITYPPNDDCTKGVGASRHPQIVVPAVTSTIPN
jgi:hypothetical protein